MNDDKSLDAAVAMIRSGGGGGVIDVATLARFIQSSKCKSIVILFGAGVRYGHKNYMLYEVYVCRRGGHFYYWAIFFIAMTDYLWLGLLFLFFVSLFLFFPRCTCTLLSCYVDYCIQPLFFF